MMKLFRDQPLPTKPHLAVFSSTKVGNFVITTPLLRGLKEKYPDCVLDFFGSEITRDFEIHSPYIDWRFSLYSQHFNFLESLANAILLRRQQAGNYDLVINCDEFSEINLVMVTALRPTYVAGGALSLDFRSKLDASDDPVQKMLLDSDWDSPGFLQRHSSLISSNYISEIFCRIAYVDTDFFKLEVPSQPPQFSVPDVLIHVTASRPAKMWSVKYWQQVIEWCQSQAFTVGLVGSSPSLQQLHYCANDAETELLTNTSLIDLRGQTSLTELAGTCRQAKVFISVDTGPMHIAAAVGCPVVAIFGNDQEGNGASPCRLWAPRQAQVKIAHSNYTCTLCQENRFRNHSCLLSEHSCMNHLKAEQVIHHIENLLEMNGLRQTLCSTSHPSSSLSRRDLPFNSLPIEAVPP
ncbi:glycosyltransferase family 9 protein [Pleurocapsa sp. PCC 7319]|uniref:glycosyltransferase family 9 protein n=1 Tax=Pleurocapsa sp. PCC 7319 TaxID=118161 RepID=UPI00034A36BC|nr:glycosyltransferase family 9 protein [Pleurocapsa sp. PCC 7319]